jgi:hypothetical protein
MSITDPTKNTTQKTKKRATQTPQKTQHRKLKDEQHSPTKNTTQKTKRRAKQPHKKHNTEN